MINNFIARNCGLTQALTKQMMDAMRDKSEMDWIQRKELARVAVDSRTWMLKIAQQNNFKFAASAYVKKLSEDEKRGEEDDKLRRREAELEEEIGGTESKIKKAGLMVIKDNKHKLLEERVEGGVAERKEGSGGGDMRDVLSDGVAKLAGGGADSSSRGSRLLSSRSAPSLLPESLSSPWRWRRRKLFKDVYPKINTQ